MKEHGPCFFCNKTVFEGNEGVGWIKNKDEKQKIFFHDDCMRDYVRSAGNGKESENRADH